MEFATQNDAITQVETLLGADGDRELAAQIVARTGWRNVPALLSAGDEAWNAAVDSALLALGRRRQPRPTPSFFRATAAPIEVLAPVDPVIPPASPTSLGRDAALPASAGLTYSSATRPWSEILQLWRARIAEEQLVDVEVRCYRSPTRNAPRGFTLRDTDGAFQRNTGGEALGYTQRAWAQLVNMLLQEVPAKPRGAPEPYRWLEPTVRADVFESIKRRSRRKEGVGSEILLRTYFDPALGLRALRAVVTGRHSGIHFDDLALTRVLESMLPAQAPAYVHRDTDETRGYAVLDQKGAARATIGWSNSETGAASLAFSGGCWIETLDAVIRDGAVVVVNGETLETGVRIANTSDRTKRAHTLPRKHRSEGERARIAAERMRRDVAKATDRSRELCRAWDRAIRTFAPGFLIQTTEDRPAAVAVVMDLIEENTKGCSDKDRAELEKIFYAPERLKLIPFASAAYIAGAWAVLAAKQTSWDEADRMQAEAARWVMRPFTRG